MARLAVMLLQASRLVPFEPSVPQGLQVSGELTWNRDGQLERSFGVLAAAAVAQEAKFTPGGMVSELGRGFSEFLASQSARGSGMRSRCCGTRRACAGLSWTGSSWGRRSGDAGGPPTARTAPAPKPTRGSCLETRLCALFGPWQI